MTMMTGDGGLEGMVPEAMMSGGSNPAVPDPFPPLPEPEPPLPDPHPEGDPPKIPDPLPAPPAPEPPLPSPDPVHPDHVPGPSPAPEPSQPGPGPGTVSPIIDPNPINPVLPQ